jgi:hypothetical protein
MGLYMVSEWCEAARGCARLTARGAVGAAPEASRRRFERGQSRYRGSPGTATNTVIPTRRRDNREAATQSCLPPFASCGGCYGRRAGGGEGDSGRQPRADWAVRSFLCVSAALSRRFSSSTTAYISANSTVAPNSPPSNCFFHLHHYLDNLSTILLSHIPLQ